jgi:hypothetical protein
MQVPKENFMPNKSGLGSTAKVDCPLRCRQLMQWTVIDISLCCAAAPNDKLYCRERQLKLAEMVLPKLPKCCMLDLDWRLRYRRKGNQAQILSKEIMWTYNNIAREGDNTERWESMENTHIMRCHDES